MSDTAKGDHLPESPYPGIDPFSYTDRNVFFAREGETRTLIRLIVIYRGVLLYSDSGTGKSSLVNAGLIPRAVDEGFQPERIRIQPRIGEEIIVERLSENATGEGRFLPSIFAADEDRTQVIMSVEDFLKTLRHRAEDVHPLVIFDQFEELITLFEAVPAARASQAKIRDAIASLINDRKLPVKVLIVLREDYLAKLAPLFERSPNLPDHYLRLIPLEGDQVRRAIRGPFDEYPGKYQPELSTSLAEEIQKQFEERSKGSNIRLTEVQIVCRSLFESGVPEPELERHFEDQDGVQGILEEYLERTLGSLEPDHQDAAIALLARMVTSAGTRNVISEEDLLSRVEHEEWISREVLRQTLDSLEGETKLVRRERRREVNFYEITSEFLVEWIRRKARERRERKAAEAAAAREKKAAEAAAERERQATLQKWNKRSRMGALVGIILAVVAVLFAIRAEYNRAEAEANANSAAAAEARAENNENLANERLNEAATGVAEAHERIALVEAQRDNAAAAAINLAVMLTAQAPLTETPTTSPTDTPHVTPGGTLSSTTETAAATPSPSSTPTPTEDTNATIVAAQTQLNEIQVTQTAIARIPSPTHTPTPALVVYVESGGQTHKLGMATSSGASIPNGISLDLAAASAWRPDGRQLAFFAEPGTGIVNPEIDREGIWTISYPPGKPKLLYPTDHVKNVAWSLREKYIAFELHPLDQKAEVVIINTTDGQIVSRFPGQQPAWYPDKNELVIKAEPSGRGCGLWQVDLGGNPERQITTDCTDSYPVISHKGQYQYLSFSSQRAGNSEDIYLMKLPDGKPQLLTGERGTDTTPVFSRDGQKIYYRSDSFRPDWQVVVMDLDGSNKVAVRNGVGPSEDPGLARPAVY